MALTTWILLGIIGLLLAAGIYYYIIPLWHIMFVIDPTEMVRILDQLAKANGLTWQMMGNYPTFSKGDCHTAVNVHNYMHPEIIRERCQQGIDILLEEAERVSNLCDECSTPVEKGRRLCPGCEAYRDHTGFF